MADKSNLRPTANTDHKSQTIRKQNVEIVMEPTSVKSSSYKPQTTKPKKHELVDFFSPMSAKWHEIGDLLGVDDDTMEGLRTSNFDNKVKLSIMLQRWLEIAEPTSVTWDEINRVWSSVTVKTPRKSSMYYNLYHTCFYRNTSI